MQFLQKHHSKVARVVMLGLLTFITCLQVLAQKPTLPAIPTSCDYTTAPANITLSVGTEPSGFSKNYLLVDMVSGAIVQTNATAPTFSNIGQGIYYVVTAYYTSGASIHNDIAGKLISDVYVDGLAGGCLKYSDAVSIKVCTTNCDLNSAPGTLSFTASPSPTAGVTTTYALVDDATNKIIQTSASSSFLAVPVGDFSIVGVYSTGTFSLAVGDTLYAKTTNDVNCVGVSNTIHYKVCSTVCLAGTTAPAITPTTATNVCPVTTVSLAALANTGTQPVGTTLIWSTHKVPTSVGDTLTNLTTLATAGKYYALYFDKVNNCYSPADSVDVTIGGCGVVSCVGSNIAAGTIAPTTGIVADNYTVNSQLSIQSLSVGGGYTDASTGYRFGTPTATTDRNYKLVFSSPVTNVVLHLGFINNDIAINSPAPAGEEAIANITAVGAPGAVYTFQDFSTSGMQNIWNSTTRTISSTVNSFGPNSNSKIQISSTTPFTEITLTHDYITGVNPFGVLLEDVCYELACVAGTTAPVITPTTATNTCPVATVSLAALANTGTKPAGTSLIWSTHKVPTSAGDTLTNLTTLAVAGKYYALYF